MVPSGHRFLTKRKDPRQWSHQRAFGAVATAELPDTLHRKPLAVFNQLQTNFCTAFAYAGALSFKLGYAVSPEYQTAMEGKVALAPITNGTTLDVMCKAGFIFGVIRDKACPIKLDSTNAATVADWTKYPQSLDNDAIEQGWYYTAHTGSHDAFDNIRNAIYNARIAGQEVAVILATEWFEEFNDAAERDHDMPLPTRASIADHAYVFFDWEPDGNGDFNALCLLSSGNEFGKDGVLRFPREVINKLFSIPLSDSRITDRRDLSQGSIKARITQLLLDAYYQLLRIYLSLMNTPQKAEKNGPSQPVQPANDNSPTVPESEAKQARLDTFCVAIRDFEGGPGDLNYRNNNPGNFRCSPVGYAAKYGSVKCVNNFAVFPSYALGWEYLQTIVSERSAEHPAWTFADFFAIYAPANDNNDPDAYARFVAKRCGVSVDTPIAAFLGDTLTA